ncbi:MAG: GNAT family N-acetyltransferase [Pseudomonadota bacterium]|nr:GNAT family N-acetyltransferase [Pseudomonadota bacterium]MEA3428507.1 GNAT family N-acetyltransferase [Thermodesulfobacteriota bacterium]
MLRQERNEISDAGWLLAKVTDFTLLNNFDCGDDDLNDFFHNDAVRYKTELMAETYSLNEATERITPVALVSLCNDHIRLDKFKIETAKKAVNCIHQNKRRTGIPAVKIARLGVASNIQGNSIGSHIINIIKKLFLINNRTGCRFLTVDAYRKDNVLNFYKKNGFQLITSKDATKLSRAMFFDLKTIQIDFEID